MAATGCDPEDGTRERPASTGSKDPQGNTQTDQDETRPRLGPAPPLLAVAAAPAQQGAGVDQCPHRLVATVVPAMSPNITIPSRKGTTAAEWTGWGVDTGGVV